MQFPSLSIRLWDLCKTLAGRTGRTFVARQCDLSLISVFGGRFWGLDSVDCLLKRLSLQNLDQGQRNNRLEAAVGGRPLRVVTIKQ